MTYNKDAWRAQVDNGKIVRSLLAEIVPRQYDPDLAGPGIMHPEAAAAMGAMLVAAAEAGHVFIVKYSYRTYAKQVEKWQNYQADPEHNNLAAYPGTSNHGWAVSGDLSWFNPAAIVWVHANCRRFGFAFDVPSENWHATYQGGFIPPKEDDDVNLDKYLEGGKKYRDRYKKNVADGKANPDPGEPPMADKYAKAGWNDARFAAAWPKK